MARAARPLVYGWLVAALVATALGAPAAAHTASGPALVRDIHPGVDPGGVPAGTTSVGDWLFFWTWDPTHGWEPWRSDGAGAAILRDIVPGEAWSKPPSEVTARVGGTLFFAADDGERLGQLWKSDGTTAGTVPVGLRPGRQHFGAFDMVAAGRRVFFVAYDDRIQNDVALWSSDGTAGGTRRLVGLSASSGFPWGAIGDTLFFTNAGQLWKSDGSPRGTVLVKEVRPQSQPLVELGGVLFFGGEGGGEGSELWRSDGTAQGTRLVSDIFPGEGGSAPQALTALGGALLFLADDGEHGRELWRSDGTAQGTRLVQDMLPGPASLFGGGSPFLRMTVAGDALFFAGTGAQGAGELWRSDGSAAGTSRLGSFSAAPQALTAFGDELFFVADDGEHGRELWRSDGSAAGTTPVAGAPLALEELHVVGQSLILVGRTAAGPVGLWRSDGSAAGTALVANLGFGRGSWPANFTPLGGDLYFTAYTEGDGRDLWRSDGSEAGTVRVKDLPRMGEGDHLYAGAHHLLELGGKLYFLSVVDSSTTALWQSDGSEAGTAPLKAFAFGEANQLARAGARLFMVVQRGTPELWVSDGSAAGTRLVKPFDMNQDDDVFLERLTPVGERVYFTFSVIGERGELWVSDGSEQGTRRVRPPGVTELAAANGKLFFVSVKEVEVGGEQRARATLWVTDHRPGGPRKLKTVDGPAFTETHPLYSLTAVGRNLFFAVNDGRGGAELWKTNGHVSGTVAVANLHAGSTSSRLLELTDVAGALFFSASDTSGGRELWRSNRAATTAWRLRNINPGALGSWPGEIAQVDRGLVALFAASDGKSGLELWRTRGTAGSTVRLADIRPGPASSAPADFVRVGDSIFFTADDGASGRELWALRP